MFQKLQNSRKSIATVAANVAVSIVVSGCAQRAGSVSPSYVSPITYQNLQCDQIREEMQRISARVAEVTGHQNKAATGDTVAMAVGLVAFWPALFFLAANNDRSAELARLKGEYEALEQSGIQKRCFTAEEQKALQGAKT